MANPKVAVIIVNWNRKEDTIECLKSLKRVSTFGFTLSVVLVDNGSTDGSIPAFSKIINISFRLIPLKENVGFVEGNNIGIKAALEDGADYILLLNNDTLVDKNLIRELVKSAEKYKTAGILTPKIYFAPGYEFHKDRYSKSLSGKVIWFAGGVIDWANVYGNNFGVDDVDRGQFDDEKETDFATGCAMFIKRKVIEKIGLLDTRYFLYFEDDEYSLRAKRAGWKTYYVPTAYLWHKVSQSSKSGSDLNDYFLTRNRMIFGIENAPVRAKLALLRESFKLLLSGRKWQKIGIRDYYLRRFGKGSWK
jgi:GT2 family glycosyltransferase